jgi:hypothetical protein
MSVPGLFSELFNVAASRPAQMTTEQLQTSHEPGLRQDKGMVNRPRRSGREAGPAVISFAFSAGLT